jgi:hypothetical protein
MNKFLSKTFLLVLSFSLLFSPNLSFKVNAVNAALLFNCGLFTPSEQVTIDQQLLAGYDPDVTTSMFGECTKVIPTIDFQTINLMHTGVVHKTYNHTTKVWEDTNPNGDIYTKSQIWRNNRCLDIVRRNSNIDWENGTNSSDYNYFCKKLYNERTKSADKKLYVSTGVYRLSTEPFSLSQINDILNSQGTKSGTEKYLFTDTDLNDNYKRDPQTKPSLLTYEYLIFTYCSTTACEGWKFFDPNTDELLEYETNKDKVWYFYSSVS